MVYDPRRSRPRHQPDVNEVSVVDTLLDGPSDPPRHNGHEPAPPPSSGVTPEPPSAWSERLLYSVGMSTVLGAAVGLVVLRWLWKTLKRRNP